MTVKYETAAEMADRLNLNIRTVQIWAKSGKLPGAQKVGRDWLIPVMEQSELEKSGMSASRNKSSEENENSADGFSVKIYSNSGIPDAYRSESHANGSESDKENVKSGETEKEDKFVCPEGRDNKPGTAVSDVASSESFVEEMMPLLNASFEPGKCKEYIESIEDEALADIAWAEYYYFSAQPEKAARFSEKYLESADLPKRLSAVLIYSFANLSLGRSSIAREKFRLIQEGMDKGMADGSEPRLQALCAFIADMSAILLHMPVGEGADLGIPSYLESDENTAAQASESADLKIDWDTDGCGLRRNGAVSARTHLSLLPVGLRIFACYVVAHQSYIEGDYGRSLGIIETALAFQEKTYPIAMIYAHLVAVMDLMCLGDTEQARQHFMQAWELAQPDDLIEAIGEHHGLTYGMIETCLKKDFPEDYLRIIEVTYRFSKGWRSIHNPVASATVADNLTTMEFSIAMLAKRGWTNQEISDYMDISVHTVKQYMSVVFQKLGISSRKQLPDYMLR